MNGVISRATVSFISKADSTPEKQAISSSIARRECP